MTAFPELYFSFPAVLGAIYHHTARQRKGWFVLSAGFQCFQEAGIATLRVHSSGKAFPCSLFCFGDVYFPHLSTHSWSCSLPDPFTRLPAALEVLRSSAELGRAVGYFRAGTRDRGGEMFLLFSRSSQLQIRAFQDKLTQSWTAFHSQHVIQRHLVQALVQFIISWSANIFNKINKQIPHGKQGEITLFL